MGSLLLDRCHLLVVLTSERFQTRQPPKTYLTDKRYEVRRTPSGSVHPSPSSTGSGHTRCPSVGPKGRRPHTTLLPRDLQSVFTSVFGRRLRRLLYSIRYLLLPSPPPPPPHTHTLNHTITLIGTAPGPSVHLRVRVILMFIPRPLLNPHVHCGTHTNPHVHCGTHTNPPVRCGTHTSTVEPTRPLNTPHLSCPALSHPVPSTAAASQPSRRARARTADDHVHGHIHVHGHGDCHATPVTSLASFRPRMSAQQPTEAGDWRQM